MEVVAFPRAVAEPVGDAVAPCLGQVAHRHTARQILPDEPMFSLVPHSHECVTVAIGRRGADPARRRDRHVEGLSHGIGSGDNQRGCVLPEPEGGVHPIRTGTHLEATELVGAADARPVRGRRHGAFSRGSDAEHKGERQADRMPPGLLPNRALGCEGVRPKRQPGWPTATVPPQRPREARGAVGRSSWPAST